MFDSLIKGYPIGVVILWNTDKTVPYRMFIDNYKDEMMAEQVDKDLWSRKDKWLVYDGQQRLQTLYSCLKFTINDRKLAYNILFDLNDNNNEDDDIDETGFQFFDKNADLPAGYISMSQLYSKTEDDEVDFRYEFKSRIDKEIINQYEQKIERTISTLFNTFVKKETKSLAYFPIDKTISEEKVNDIFQRLNSGGVPLSGADLLFSKIKEKKPEFEENLQKISINIFALSSGYSFSRNSILQVIHLIVKGNTRIDPERVKKEDIDAMIETASKIVEPLKEFFEFFILQAFKINNNSLVSRGLAILPLIVYLYKNYNNGLNYRNLSNVNIQRMKQYFILSQLNDWNTQTIVKKACEFINQNDDFPLEEIIDEINKHGNRRVDVSIENLENHKWFTLKIILNERLFVKANVDGRYAPELDHIFPQKLENRPEDYSVDIVWNMQPVTGIINASKSNQHPKDFFMQDTKKEYITYYDFLPESFDDIDWTDHEIFIKNRKEKMINKFKELYQLEVHNE